MRYNKFPVPGVGDAIGLAGAIGSGTGTGGAPPAPV